jgi:hypothetical protein
MAARRNKNTEKSKGGKTAEPTVPRADMGVPHNGYVAKAAGFKKGGAVGRFELPMDGASAAHKRLDRAGRKRGGSVGADSSPLTSAANLSPPSAKGNS